MIENSQEIKDAVSVEQVLKDIGYLKSSPYNNGSEVRDFCPLHGGDKQRSLCFNIATKEGKCHAGECDFTGDHLELYMRCKNISFPEALKYFANQSGIKPMYITAIKTDFPNNTQQQVPEKIQSKKSSLVKTDRPNSTPHRTPQQVLAESSTEGDHPYLHKKCIKAPPGLYFGYDDMGNYSVIVPFYSVDGELKTVQFRHLVGIGKYFLTGARQEDGFFSTGLFKDGDKVYLAEGIATTATTWEALGEKTPVISFGSAGKLPTIVAALQAKYPNIKLVICLEKDAASYINASKIKNTNGCTFVIPSFEGLTSENPEDRLKDFNDLVSKCNQPLSVVREQLMIEKHINNSPIGINQQAIAHDSEQTLTNTIAQDDQKITVILTTDHHITLEIELLNYIYHTSFEDLINNGTDPDFFPADLFTGDRRPLAEGIIKTWELGLLVTKSEVAVQLGNNADKAYSILNTLDNMQTIVPQQALQRAAILREYNAKQKVNHILQRAISNNDPLEKKIENLRKDLDSAQGTSETVFSQAASLHEIIANIKDPGNEPIFTGFKSVDRLIGGFKKGELGILSGGAGQGKSAIALQIADNVASSGACAVYLSVEIGVAKLTERSFKRLSKSSKLTDNAIDIASEKYTKFADNIFIIKGRSGMLLSEIRTKILNIRRQRKAQGKSEDIVLTIDPYQRLGTGNEKLDHNNETGKLNVLLADIKQMAEDLNIHILILSDTTKNHKDNSSGEGVSRGTYMADHTADYTMMIRTSRDPLIALYGTKGGSSKEAKDANVPTLNEDPFVENITKAINGITFTSRYKLGDWDKYAVLVTPKVRDGGKFNPLFHYKPAIHTFIETDVYDRVFPATEENQ